jgi:hypothetical protein
MATEKAIADREGLLGGWSRIRTGIGIGIGTGFGSRTMAWHKGLVCCMNKERGELYLR